MLFLLCSTCQVFCSLEDIWIPNFYLYVVRRGSLPRACWHENYHDEYTHNCQKLNLSMRVFVGTSFLRHAPAAGWIGFSVRFIWLYITWSKWAPKVQWSMPKLAHSNNGATCEIFGSIAKRNCVCRFINMPLRYFWESLDLWKLLLCFWLAARLGNCDSRRVVDSSMSILHLLA